jgi:PAS domain S-box-containing protein
MSKEKVMVVEDEFVVAENIRVDLESMGYQVVGMASSGEQALTLARQKKPDIALMDIKLIESMDGIEIAMELRKHQDIPVLFLTSFVNESYLNRAKLVEPLGYVIKPYEKKSLQASMEMACYKAKMERLLKESELRFRSMFEYLPVAYLAVDVSGDCIDFNDELCRILKYDPQELAGRHFADLWDPEIRHEYSNRFSALQEQGCLQTELILVCKDDSRITVLFEGKIQYDTEGNYFRTHCILHNITEYKRIEAERQQWMQRIQQTQKAESLARMAGAIAHHFNNQLHVITGNLEMALEDMPPNPSVLESLNEAMKAAGKSAEVSGLMLTYLGQSPGKRELLDLSQVCTECLPMIRITMPKDVVLETNFQFPGPVVEANANQLRQVILNLVTNAWEAADNGPCSINMNVQMISSEMIPASNRFPIDWKPSGLPHACLEIMDTGCGIAEKDLGNIFDPFFTTKFTGRGLGLSVVMGIIHAHGGGINVESGSCHGSTFRVFLPVSDQGIAALPEKAVIPPENKAAGITMLLVDDDVLVREMVKAMIKRMGITVLEARDGVEAVEIFQQHREVIRCVLSDLTMPRMDGWELLTVLRKLSPDIPVILSSGYDEAKVMAGEHPERPNAFLGKPYHRKNLCDMLNQIL